MTNENNHLLLKNDGTRIKIKEMYSQQRLQMKFLFCRWHKYIKILYSSKLCQLTLSSHAREGIFIKMDRCDPYISMPHKKALITMIRRFCILNSKCISKWVDRHCERKLLQQCIHIKLQSFPCMQEQSRRIIIHQG